MMCLFQKLCLNSDVKAHMNPRGAEKSDRCDSSDSQASLCASVSSPVHVSVCEGSSTPELLRCSAVLASPSSAETFESEDVFRVLKLLHVFASSSRNSTHFMFGFEFLQILMHVLFCREHKVSSRPHGTNLIPSFDQFKVT